MLADDFMFPVRPYTDADCDGVIDVILPIQQQEFGVGISLADQPDLRAIHTFYQKGNGNFWVAVESGRIVGTVALLDIGEHRGALRKMFVRRECRGRATGVAQALLDTLLAWARHHQLREILLGTTDKYHAAHRFYERNGFARLDKRRLPSGFPVMAVDCLFYHLEL